MDADHETLSHVVEQVGALAAQGFGDQEDGRLVRVKPGRMELDELHVADGGAGAVGHGHAIAGRDPGIGGQGIDLAGAAGGQHRGCGEIEREFAGLAG